MTFYVVLALVNVACFLPLYALNFREQPNPFAFLKDTGFITRKTLRLLYARQRYTDPFRINFDYTFLVLISSNLTNAPAWIRISLAAVLFLGFVEILYATIMHQVFRRAPSLASDLALLRTGWSVAHNYRYVIAMGIILILAGILVLAGAVTAYLFSVSPGPGLISLTLAALLAVPCLYHWRRYSYSDFFWRATYSPSLHFSRNLAYSSRTKGLLNKDAKYFDGLNEFKSILLEKPPNIVIICVESYGSIVYKDTAMHSALADSVDRLSRRLATLDYGVASNFSEAPIFAGGSWLSYSSLTHGTLFDDAYLYEGLFSNNGSFDAYESLFHVLERNGYANNLLCPLGGVSSRYVNWESIDRCFRPQRKFDFDSLNYQGTARSFFVPNDLYAAPDQYALNYSYETLKNSGNTPFSLFFCTLNSHYPWTSNFDVVSDWRRLNDPATPAATADRATNLQAAYIRAIRYQLEYIFNFVIDNAADNLLLIAFGDHQPPMITAESMGRQTPIHLVSREPKLIDSFLQRGFAPTLDLAGARVEPMRHEGFLSLLMGALNAAYGEDPALSIRYRRRGVRLLDED